MHRCAILIAIVALFGFAGEAVAKVVTLEDRDGRAMKFDVRSNGIDVEWYAELLRNATHGDEISSVTVRIVRPALLPRLCGAGASGCYERTPAGPRIVVPSGRNADVAHTLLHEYGHHIDVWLKHGGLRELNGTRAWWAARKMAIRLQRGKVAFDYRRGWSRSIGEIFAEDYAQTQLRTKYDIRWLGPPGPAVIAALERDLGALPAEPARPDVDPLVLRRSGTIDPGRRVVMRFGLLGPDRRVTFTVTMRGKKQIGTRARIQLSCGGAVVRKSLRRGAASLRIDRPGLGPGECQVSVLSTARKSLAYSATLKLSVEG